MATYKSKIAYDGTEFHGFQRQAEGLRTVQATLEAALRQIGWNGSSLRAAGRTDAGVHARGQVIAFSFEWRHPAGDLTRALNANLPPDVAAWHTEPAPEGFDPRFEARRRRYRYRVITAPYRDPLRERYAWRIWPEPDWGRMAETADHYLGRRDFGAFGSAPIEGGHTIREIYESAWESGEEAASFVIAGDAFLYRMVRRLVAAAIDVGLGRVEIDEVLACLSNPGQHWQASLAPSYGLCLEAVEFETD